MITRVAVVVPAADEQDAVAACLHSLAVARRELHRVVPSVRTRVLVVLDGCRDATAAVVAHFGDVETLACGARSAGAARRLGAAAVLARDRPAREVWIAATDADCVVPPDWLLRQFEAARRGAQLVLGTVQPGPGLPAPVERAWRAAHSGRDGHPHVHGANLGIAAPTYLALGGWRPLATGEDADLVARARAAGHVRIHRLGGLPVVTSSRLHGRAPGGFAAYLRELHAGQPCAARTAVGCG